MSDEELQRLPGADLHLGDSAAEAEKVRIRRLREDAERPISVNLAETIELSHALLKMVGNSSRR